MTVSLQWPNTGAATELTGAATELTVPLNKDLMYEWVYAREEIKLIALAHAMCNNR